MAHESLWHRHPLLSRRTLILGAATATLAGTLLDAQGMTAAADDAPTTPDAVAALARSTVGLTLQQLQDQVMVQGHWARFHGEWCAVYATWLLRGVGISFTDSSFAAYGAAPEHPTVPAIGDLIYYPDPGHIGIVTAIVDGVPQTVEGNGPGDVAWSDSVVQEFRSPWRGGYLFARPAWPVIAPDPPKPIEEDEMVRIVTYASSNFRSGTYLAAPGYWHRFSTEEWASASTLGLFANVPVITVTDDVQFDQLHAIFTTVDKRTALSPLGESR